MRRPLIRADDVGRSPAVGLGIARSHARDSSRRDTIVYTNVLKAASRGPCSRFVYTPATLRGRLQPDREPLPVRTRATLGWQSAPLTPFATVSCLYGALEVGPQRADDAPHGAPRPSQNASFREGPVAECIFPQSALFLTCANVAPSHGKTHSATAT